MIKRSNATQAIIAFGRFQKETRSEWRFMHSRDTEMLLDTIGASLDHRIELIAKGTKFWRAQLGYDIKEEVQREPVPYTPERMAPRPNGAREGRINPKGIPCLYLATERDTAMSEVRPWAGSLVTVAEFEVVRDLRIVDCARRHNEPILPMPDQELDPTESLWQKIDYAFAQPITNRDDEADYAHTQILAELFRKKEFDGIKHKSTVGLAYNVALFDVAAASCLPPKLFQVVSNKFDFQELTSQRA